MGNYFCCQEFAQTLPCSSENKSHFFKNKLRKNLNEGEFKELCLLVVDRHYDETLELGNQEILRHSGGFTHYETSSLNPSINEIIEIPQQYEHQHQPSSPSSSHSKRHYLLKLIMQSYLFLDFSDCMDSQQSYERIIRHELMSDDPSLDGSFLVNSKAVVASLESQLINFNPQLIEKLQRYVRFCRKVKYDFTPDRHRFLSKLNLNLQSKIIQKYLTREFRRDPKAAQSMFKNVQEILDVLMITVQTMYDFQLQKGQDVAEEEFFNSTNIYTMITSILFENQDFAAFIINKIRQCFRHRFNFYRNEPDYSTSEFISDFIALNSRESRRESRISLTGCSVSATSSTSPYRNIRIFLKSGKILDKLFRKSVPLFKLKIIYQLNQQISKQLIQLKQILMEHHGVSIKNVFTRQTELLAVKWLLRAHSSKIDDIASHLIFTYQFVHHVHLLDKKGSCLVTFMQEIQRIIKWSFPS